jgi:preflagellin peptidase FlaK
VDTLEAVRLGATLLMLAGAALLDLRTRRVPNRYWLPFAALAIVLWPIDGIRHGWAPLLAPALVAAALSAGFWLVWRLRLFGGADAKGLIVFAVLSPVPWFDSTTRLPPVVDAFCNLSLFVIAIPFLLLVANVARGRFSFPAVLLAVPMPIEGAKQAHVWPMHRVDESGKVRWRYWQQTGRNLAETYDQLAAAGMTEVWATPKLPFLAFVAAGALLASWLGNIPLRLALAAAGGSFQNGF